MSAPRGAKLRAAAQIGRALARTLADEAREGTLSATLVASLRARELTFVREPSFAELLERRAVEAPAQVFVRFEDRLVTHGELDAGANAVAAGLRRLGVGPGEQVAVVSPNCPEVLEAFFAVQKLGAGYVPVNVALVGDGLAHVLDHARARVAIVHRDCLPAVRAVRHRAGALRDVLVIADGEPVDGPTLEGLRGEHRGASAPGVSPHPDAVGLLMYTSGTSGAPKGVVYRYAQAQTKRLRLLAHLLYDARDVLYTCLPLYHANALLLTTVQALNARARMVLARRFSASRFWEEVARSGATTFNALGAMIPILLKQPPSEWDRRHAVRTVVSAACPREAWRPFEERFGVRIVEAYGAVDGGGFLTLNLGNAPVGSIGRPLGGRYRLVGEDGRDVPHGAPGELWVWTGARGRVEYYRDGAATDEKTRDGWLRTGDLLVRDEGGDLYFAGRTTDSMRRRGENVSAFEVESILDTHPDVLESPSSACPASSARRRSWPPWCRGRGAPWRRPRCARSSRDASPSTRFPATWRCSRSCRRRGRSACRSTSSAPAA
ncbi:MAG: AMP-binding protein [Sandaracinaceae bacterium]|nr:AMP-binding protein [Sandaracinaceae bacterium]